MAQVVAVGTVVKTPYGVGKVVEFREVDALYKIVLDSWVLSGGSLVAVFSQAGQFTTVEAPVEEKVEEKVEEEVKAVEAVPEVVAEVVAEEKAVEAVPEVVAEVVVEEKKAEEVVAEKVEEVAVAAVEEPIAAEAVDITVAEAATTTLVVGTPVKTPYGVGKVVEVRANSMYKIRLDNWLLSGDSRVFVFSQGGQFTTVTEEEAKAVEAKAVEAKAAVEPVAAKTEEKKEEKAAEKKEEKKEEKKDCQSESSCKCTIM